MNSVRRPKPRKVRVWERLHPTWKSVYYGNLLWEDYYIVQTWIKENLQNSDWIDYHEGVHLIYFRNEEDTTAFKLKFQL